MTMDDNNTIGDLSVKHGIVGCWVFKSPNTRDFVASSGDEVTSAAVVFLLLLMTLRQEGWDGLLLLFRHNDSKKLSNAGDKETSLIKDPQKKW